jgi:hypothetical protein
MDHEITDVYSGENQRQGVSLHMRAPEWPEMSPTSAFFRPLMKTQLIKHTVLWIKARIGEKQNKKLRGPL